MNEKNMDVIFVIDRSGSMYGFEEDTMGGFNSIIDEHIKDGINSRITTVLFDSEYEVLFERKPVGEVNHLTQEQYYVGGSTALLDAVGMTITTMDRKVGTDVLFVIITDGNENSSKEYSKNQVKNLIESHDWEFIFLGADIDSFTEASNIGIRRSNVANYSRTSDGIRKAYSSVDRASRRVYDGREMDSSWKEDLE